MHYLNWNSSRKRNCRVKVALNYCNLQLINKCWRIQRDLLIYSKWNHMNSFSNNSGCNWRKVRIREETSLINLRWNWKESLRAYRPQARVYLKSNWRIITGKIIEKALPGVSFRKFPQAIIRYLVLYKPSTGSVKAK